MITVRKRDILFENQNKFFENQVHILVQTGHLYNQMKTELGRGVLVKTSIFRKKMIRALSSANSCKFIVNFTDECFQITPSGPHSLPNKNVNKNVKPVKTARPVVHDASARYSLAVRLTAFGGSVGWRNLSSILFFFSVFAPLVF
jgi:hypothetical protein